MTMTWDWEATLWLLLTFIPGALIHELGHVLAFVLGGPAASALLFAAFWPGAWADVVWWPAGIDTWQEVGQWWGLWGVIVPLFPLRYPSGIPSDGLQVLTALRDLMVKQRRSA